MLASGITDGAGFARHFADALRRAWRIHCQRAQAARTPLPAGTITAPMRGPLRVVVPDTLGQITPYVLAEQHDWFEDEIDFVRAALVRGDRAVDIGANHGVYALAIAQRVGFTGRVWAFEPGGAVAERLRASLQINGLPQAEVVAAAVSDHEGGGTLVGGAHSELGHLRRAQDAGDASAGRRRGRRAGHARRLPRRASGCTTSRSSRSTPRAPRPRSSTAAAASSPRSRRW